MERWEPELDNEMESGRDYDSPESSSTPSTELNEYLSAIGGSKVNELFATYEQSPNADPYQGLAQLSRKFGEQFSTGDYKINNPTQEFIQRAGTRLRASSDTLNKTFGRSKFSSDSLIRPERSGVNSGFTSRAGVEEYSKLINSGESFKGVFFQFQEKTITSQLIKKRGSWEVLTQAFDFNNVYGQDDAGKRTTASILAPNALTLDAARLNKNPESGVRSVSTLGSFHPKVGYSDKYAFIGTQNLTSALARKSSLESLLIFERGRGATPSTQFQNLVAGELLRFTDTALGIAKSQKPGELLRPGALMRNINNSGDRSYLYVNQEALPRLTNVIKTAAYSSTTDTVAISMGEISLLLSKARGNTSTNLVSELKSAMQVLAQSGRLSLITDSGKLNKVLGETDLNLDKDFLLSLVNTGYRSALRTAVTSFQHEKGVAVFGKTGELKFLSLGSANMSSFAMLPINQQDPATQNLIKKTFGELSSDELADTINTEATLMIGAGRYADTQRNLNKRQSTLAAAYLTDLTQQGKVGQHFNTLAGGLNKTSEPNYYTGYLAERSASTTGVKQLQSALELINKTVGANIVEVQQRFAPDISRTLDPVGLRVTVKGLDTGSPHRISVDLSVNQEGNVILSDLNKIISGSIFVNKSRSTKELLSGERVSAGEARQLNAIETTTGLISTLARSFNYQTRYGLVTQVFNDLLRRDTELRQTSSGLRQVLNNTFRQELPELRVKGNQTLAPNFASVINYLYRTGDITSLRDTSQQVLLRLATGNYAGNPLKESFTPDQIEKRLDLLAPAFKPLNNKMALGMGMADKTFTTFLLRTLSADQEGLLNDLKLALIQQDASADEQYSSAARVQSRSLLSAVTAPFLAAHEQGYAAYQGMTRLPVYGEETDFIKTFGNNAYSRIAELGLLNPLAMKHGTYIGAPGQYFRAVGAVANKDLLRLPGYGGLAQLKVVDSDLSTGAAVVHDLDKLSQSTSGISLLSAGRTKQELLGLLRLQGKSLNKSEEDEIDERLGVLLSQPKYALPFPKLEQIPQRLKNIQGQRPAFEINNLFAQAVRGLDSSLLQTLNPDQYLSSRLREVLPSEQFSKVREMYDLLRQSGRVVRYEDIQAYFRDYESDPLITQRGFLGGRAMKRVALQAGASLMGDFSYGNAAYLQELGSINRLRLKVHQDSIANPITTQALLSEVLQKGTVVTTQLTPVQDSAVVQEILNKVGAVRTSQQANERLAQVDARLADQYLLRMNDTGQLQVLMKEGLYVPSDLGYQRRGSFTQDGYIAVENLITNRQTHLGQRTEPILLRFPAFGKRHQQGASVITQTPSLTISSRGTLVAETDVLTLFQPTTGSRVVGGGLAKGPIMYTTQELFNKAQSVLNKTSSRVQGTEASYQELLPSAMKRESLYEMRSFSLFKGYNYESGMYLLSQADSRNALLRTSDTEIVRSLSLLFLKDPDIKQALVESLRSSGLRSAASAVLNTEGFDASKSNLSQLASGLVSLGGKEALLTQDLNKVKSLIRLALNKNATGQAAALLLGQRTRSLLTQAVSGKDALVLGSTTLLDEGSGINKGAGLVAHMLFFNRQLFSQGQRAGLNGAMLERRLDDVGAYNTNSSHRMFVDMVASQAGMSLVGLNQEQLNKRLKTLQAIVGSGFTLENIVEQGISKSLVPAGMNDQVKMEFQYLLGLTTQYLKPYEKLGGLSDHSISIQQTYSVLSALAQGQRIGLPTQESFLQYKLAVLDVNNPENSTGLLRRQDLHLRRALLSGTSTTEDNFRTTLNNLSLNKRGGKELGTLERAAQIITGVGEASINERAVALQERMGLSYFSPEVTRAGGVAPLEFMSVLLAQNYEDYKSLGADLEARSELVPTFAEFIKEGYASENLTQLTERYRLDDSLLNKIGTRQGTYYEQARAELLRLNQQHVDRINQSRNTSLADQYLNNMLLAERWAAEQVQSGVGSAETRDLLRDVQKSQQLVLPAYELIPTEDQGKYRVSFRAPNEVAPNIGVLLGTDILGNAALTFGNYKDDILTKQVELSSSLIENQGLLAKINRYGSNLMLNEAEASQLNKLRTSIEESRLSVEKLLETDLVRKAFGDHESYKGAVGIAVASFGLDSDEFVGGERFHTLIENDQIGQVINNQAELLIQSGFKDESINQYLQLANALSPDKQDEIQQQVQAAQALQQSGSEAEIKALLTTAVYEVTTGLSPGEIANKRLTEEGRAQLDKLAAFSLGGGIRRSGAPAGMSGITGEGIHYTGMGASAYNQKLNNLNKDGLLRLDESKFKTGMLLPALSRLLSGLGDYDGDSYQLLFSRIGESATDINKTQQDLLRATRDKRKLETLIQERARRKQQGVLLSASYDEQLQTKLAKASTEVSELELALTQSLNLINQQRGASNRAENRALRDVRQMTQSFLALPDSLIGNFDGREGLSTGNLISLISQKFSLDGINDAAPHIQRAEQNINLFGKLFDTSIGGYEFDSDALNPNRVDAYTEFLLRDSDKATEPSLLREQVIDVLEYGRGRIQSRNDYEQVMTEYFASSANLTIAFDNVSGSLKKASGSLLNPFEFEAMQSLIGRGGTELIGKTYNAFIPLLDQAAMESALAGAMSSSDKMKSTLGAALGEESALYQKLSSEEFINKSRQRFFGVTGVLGAMQQLIRDALKAKGGDLKELINRKIDTEFGELTLGEALDQMGEEDSPLESDKKRIELLKSTLNATLGPVIKSSQERNPFLTSEDSPSHLLRREDIPDPGITGFGALLDFAEYTVTKPDDLVKRFIEPRGLNEQYQEMLMSQRVESADEFVSKYMLGLIERTQASYLADTFGDNVRGLLISQAQEYKQYIDAKPDGAESLKSYNRMEYDLIKEYEQLKETGLDGAKLDRQLLEEMILLNIRRTNEESSVLTPAHLQDLRDKAIGANALRFGIDVNNPEFDGIEQRMALGNQMTYNAYIRRMRRGQQLDISEAMYAASFKLNYIDTQLKELGYDPNSLESQTAKEKALLMSGINPFTSGVLSGEEQQQLIQGLLRQTEDGVNGFEQLRQTSAALNKMTGYLNVAQELSESPEVESQRELNKISRTLQGLFDGQRLNVDRLQELEQEQGVPTPDNRTLISQLEERIGQMTQGDDLIKSQDSELLGVSAKGDADEPASLRLRSSAGLEAIGALASPVLLALMATDLKLDERAGMFAVDSLQALAQNAADSRSMVSSLTQDVNNSAAQAFTRSRLRQSIENEGFVLGTLQGVAQESLFRGINDLTQAGLNKMLGSVATTKTTGQAAVRLGTELVSTVLGQGLARALSKKRVSETGGYTPDLVSRLVSDFIESVWRMAEEVQLSLLSPEYEVTDTEENLQMDFELSAIPSELEWDIETGLVVLDQDANPMPTDFEGSNTERFSMVQSVNALT